MTEIDTMRLSEIAPALTRDHYVLAPYGTTETWQHRLVVVVPTLSRPAWVLRKGTRKPTRRNRLALAVPHLEAITLELAQQHTGVITDFITVHPYSQEERARGGTRIDPAIAAPW